MIKKTFIPNWYVDKKNQIRNKKTKICIIMILMINILFVSFILNISNKIKNIEGSISNQKKNVNVSGNVKGVEMVKNDITTIENYKQLSNFMEENNLYYKNMIITQRNIEIEMEVKTHEEYIVLIKCIENHYSIKKLTPNIKEKGNFNFKVILGV